MGAAFSSICIIPAAASPSSKRPPRRPVELQGLLGRASAERGVQEFGDGQVLIAKNQVALQKVIQLAEIARPGMILAGLQQRRRKRERPKVRDDLRLEGF